MFLSIFASSVLTLLGPTSQNLSACRLIAPIASQYNAIVSDPFRQSKCDRCAGNRGIEYATQMGTPIIAGANGVVSFSGLVANKKYLVIRTTAGRRLTYGSILSSNLRVGDSVVAGQIMGTTSTMLYFGVRETASQNSAGQNSAGQKNRDIYVDPAGYLSQNSRPLRRAVLVSGAETGLDSVNLRSTC